MKNRNLEHSDNWATPKEFYNKLNEEFNFDFDPCPLNTGEITPDKDGLLIDWGRDIFIKFIEWKKSNVQNVENSKPLITLPQELIEKEDLDLNVEPVNQLTPIKEEKRLEKIIDLDTKVLKNINWNEMEGSDVQNVKLLNHLILLLLLLTQDVNQDSVPIVKHANVNLHDSVWKENVETLKESILLKLQKIDIDSLLKEEKDIENEALSEIIYIEQLLLNGLRNNGNPVNYTLSTSVPIVNQKNFLLKTILSLYQILVASEQSQKILFQHVLDATAQNLTEIHMNGLPQKLSQILSNISIRLNHRANVFVNPPYSRKLKEAFVLKAIEESKKGKLCVMLLPVSTSTKLFHDHILPNAKSVRFVKGRIAFEGINTKGEFVGKGSAPMHDSMIVIFS